MLNPASSETTEDYPVQIQSELDQSRKALKEVSMMLEQSQTEMSKLTQRSSAINGHLQQVQSQFDSMPRADIRTAYNAALDAQQRLLVMRGQLEKLQSDEVPFEEICSDFRNDLQINQRWEIASYQQSEEFWVTYPGNGDQSPRSRTPTSISFNARWSRTSPFKFHRAN